MCAPLVRTGSADTALLLVPQMSLKRQPVADGRTKDNTPSDKPIGRRTDSRVLRLKGSGPLYIAE